MPCLYGDGDHAKKRKTNITMDPGGGDFQNQTRIKPTIPWGRFQNQGTIPFHLWLVECKSGVQSGAYGM
ncbi:MAG: hypothetical protein JW915_03855 [Chitinispirillaceae bacterium]|nr:hypothetical protein [Chitinispirillaceae bacterium]